MGQPSGAKMVGPCPYCGKRYKRTNWMIRFHGPTDENGYILRDTHLIACWRKHTTITRPISPVRGA